MKQFIVILWAIILVFAVASCQKEDEIINQSVPSTQVDMGTPDPGDSGDSLIMNTKATMATGYIVSPRFGKPNSTYYNFKVYDPAGTLSLSVKLYDRVTGSSTYLPMTKTGSYWLLSMKISNSGCYAYNYVYSINKNPINSSVSYADLWNSKNTFNASGTSSLSWPFGADGSSWSNRTIGGQTWRGGEETKNTAYHYGYGWNEGTHTGTTERYSDDWNRGTGTQDLGAIIRSPLDGYIDTYGTYSTSFGSSKYVSIIQQGSDGNLYRFYVGHLQSYPSNIYSGKYVRAGVDQIGTLGSTGASSPHAHTNMRVNGVSVSFYFNAQGGIALAFVILLNIGEVFLPYAFLLHNLFIMKYLFLFSGLFVLGLAGCNQTNNVEPNNVDQTTGINFSGSTIPLIINGNLDSQENIIGSGYAFSLDSHTLLYDNFFSISLPKNLQFWTNEYQSYENLRLDFYTENSSKNRLQGYLKLYVVPVSEWRKELTDEEKCVFGNYDEGVISKKTLSKIINNKKIYTTYATFSFLDNTRKQADLCFIENNLIYTISVGGYNTSYIQNILDSFIFLN